MLPQNSFMDLLTVKGIQKLEKKKHLPKKDSPINGGFSWIFPMLNIKKSIFNNQSWWLFPIFNVENPSETNPNSDQLQFQFQSSLFPHLEALRLHA